MKKTQLGGAKRKVGVWGAMASGVILSAMAWSLSANQPIKDAQTYSCNDSCYFNYRSCLMQGKGQAFCSMQYQICNLNCAYGGSSARESD